ncbi:hypothetical protein ASZ90_017066 [hydrocarbon metagenome]|uniref:Uncharacterized protein n=1 Tax=hydrocarbon metagenome TaxID=938273 RepID=A0A0W8EAE7_9ZZZZ
MISGAGDSGQHSPQGKQEKILSKRKSRHSLGQNEIIGVSEVSGCRY